MADKLKAPPKKARALSGSGALPKPENLLGKTPEQLVTTLRRFGIDPDIAGIDARGKRAMAKFDRMLDEGIMPDDATFDALAKQNEREFNQNLRKMTKTSIRLYREDGMDEESLQMWMTSGGDNVCGSCEPRHGVVRTLAEWRKRGLPGSFSLLCGEECNCQLLPA